MQTFYTSSSELSSKGPLSSVIVSREEPSLQDVEDWHWFLVQLCKTGRCRFLGISCKWVWPKSFSSCPNDTYILWFYINFLMIRRNIISNWHCLSILAFWERYTQSCGNIWSFSFYIKIVNQNQQCTPDKM